MSITLVFQQVAGRNLKHSSIIEVVFRFSHLQIGAGQNPEQANSTLDKWIICNNIGY